MFGGTARKAVPSYICNNEILTVVSDNLFPVCTRTYSITHGCAKRLNSTHLLTVSNSAQHVQLDGFSGSDWNLEDARKTPKSGKIKQASAISEVDSESYQWQNGRLFLKNKMSHSWPRHLPCEPGREHWCQSNRHAQQMSKSLVYIQWY